MNSNAHFEYVRHKYLIKLILWIALYICKTTEAEILSCHIYDILECQVLYCTVVTAIPKVTLLVLS